MTTSLSRARGCMLGQIAGDSLGSLVEFRSRDSIAKEYAPLGGPRELAAGGTFNTLAGQPTDDSEMALAMARSMLRRGGWVEDDVAAAYIDWADSQPFDMGGTTASGIALLRADKRSTSTSQANGALMRCSPIGIRYAGNPKRAADVAEADAMLTHPSPVCVACNRAYAAAIAVLIAGGHVSQAFDAAWAEIPVSLLPEISDVLADAQAARMPTAATIEGPKKGWVLVAFQLAFAWLAFRGEPGEAVIATVEMAGDTDTNAAIVGALLGAAHGEDAFPLQWRSAVLGCMPGLGLAPRPRPAVYWPHDYQKLSAALYAPFPYR